MESVEAWRVDGGVEKGPAAYTSAVSASLVRSQVVKDLMTHEAAVQSLYYDAQSGTHGGGNTGGIS